MIPRTFCTISNISCSCLNFFLRLVRPLLVSRSSSISEKSENPYIHITWKSHGYIYTHTVWLVISISINSACMEFLKVTISICSGHSLADQPVAGGVGPNTCYGDFGAGCIIEGGLLTQVQTHAMGPLTWLYYRGWPANTGPNTCYGDFGAH